MKSSIVKRSVAIGGHKTSVSLEEPFWTDLKQIAHVQHVTLSALVTQIDDTREQSNLSSAIRVFVLRHSRLAQWPGHGLAANATSFSAAGSSRTVRHFGHPNHYQPVRQQDDQATDCPGRLTQLIFEALQSRLAVDTARLACSTAKDLYLFWL